MNTTISISTEIRDKIKEFGHKGETYEVILERLYDSAKERQLYDLLMDDSDCITLKEATKRLSK